jgi:single-stranded-DNA-specific exonuclease
LIGQLLLNRSVQSIQEAHDFLGNNWDDWPTLPNQSLFMDHLSALIEQKAPICVYGDYDVDGVTSTAMMVALLRAAGTPVDYISPHRFNDGYGLNMHRMASIAQKKYAALITLDCGVSNVAEIAHLKSLAPNMIVLILDHHKCPESLPDADAIVNPQLAPPNHPAYHLCSAALVDYLFRTTPIHGIDPTPYVDLVALGLVADIMPLTKLNRWYVKQGLAAIHASPRDAILELCISSRVHHEHLTTKDIGFNIGPRLNAPGRLGDPRPVVELLLSTDPIAIKAQVQRIEQLNNKRRAIGEKIQVDIEEQLSQNHTMNEEKGIICSGQFWHMGIIGINASKLVNKYHKPAVVIGFENDTARGSARSIPGVNIYSILSKCAPMLHHFGGHSQAAGFSLDPQNIVAFKRQFIEHCNDINDADTMARLQLDAELPLADVSLALIDQLDALAPFGEGNPSPLFYTNASVLDARKVGQTNAHIKFRFEQNAAIIDGIGFYLSDHMAQIDTQHVWIAFHISKNEFRGSVTPQLNVIDIKPYEPG